MLRLILLVAVMKTASSIFDERLNEMYLTMPRAEFVIYFNSQNYTWKMAEEAYNNSFVGCLTPDPVQRKTLPTIHHSLEAITNAPKNFDARTQWAQCESIKRIYDQGDCGSCWTFGCATTASDRTCIHKDVHVDLSEQDFECLSEVCDGGYNIDAMIFWKKIGLVSQACKPYDIDKLNQKTCTKKCVNDSINYNNDKHFGSVVYQVRNIANTIKAELSKNGPVVATMAVYPDFYHDYHSGIYEHKYGDLLGLHSVRILGYGTENGVDYWLAANSWGVDWGESGFFRMKQNQPDVLIESAMTTGKP